MAEGVGNYFKFLIATSSAGVDVGLANSTFICGLYSTGWIDESTQRVDFSYLLDAADSSASFENYELSTVGAAYDRVTLGARTISQVNARDAIEIDAADVTFTSVSSSAGVAGGMAIFAEIAASDSSGRILTSYYDFSSPVTPNGGDITVQFSTGGFLEHLASTSDAS